MTKQIALTDALGCACELADIIDFLTDGVIDPDAMISQRLNGAEFSGGARGRGAAGCSRPRWWCAA